MLISCNLKAQIAYLNGTASTNAASYKWRQVSGKGTILQKSDSVICKVSGLIVGTYLYELTCTNKLGKSKDSVKFTVVSGKAVTVSKKSISTFLWIDNISWTTTLEVGVSGYLIESKAGALWVKMIQIKAKGKSSYNYTNTRSWSSSVPKYRLTPVFIDQTLDTPININ